LAFNPLTKHKAEEIVPNTYNKEEE